MTFLKYTDLIIFWGTSVASAVTAERPPGIPVREFPSREFPGIRHPKNSRREFPGITEFSVRVSGSS